MAYVNVLEWRAEQVAEWLCGLDDSIKHYAHYFVNNNVNGQQLLNLTVSDSIKLHVEKLGHQEIIFEALDRLKHLHHNLDTENLQYVALKLSCKVRSLYNEICMNERHVQDVATGTTSTRQTVDTPTMASVADVMDTLMVMLSWLDRPPFGGDGVSPTSQYRVFKKLLLEFGIQLATNSQRDTFAEKPMDVIKTCCKKVAELSDALIRDIADPLILQPASLDVVTTKRRPDDENFGLVLDNTTPGVHVINEVKFGSFSHQCGRIKAGDEIVQINYQTVVGWTAKKTLQLMEENPSELILTLKKRPRHLPTFGQIYMKPFRIPARQNATMATYFNNLPSPRAELLVAPDISFPITKRRSSAAGSIKNEDRKSTSSLSMSQSSKANDSNDVADVVDDNDVDEVDDDDDDVDEDDDEIYLPTTSSTKDISPTQSVRSLLLRPRSTPIRRATISAGSPSKHQPYINVSEIWSGLFDNVSHKSNKSDESKQSSNTSTIRSNDSGCATMYSSSMANDFNEKGRPLTVGPEYMNMASGGAPHNEYINLFACSTSTHNIEKPPLLPPKQPVPKPRLTVTLSKEDDKSGAKKKPVPQPRSFTAKKSGDNLVFMSSDVKPVPTSNFKSFKKFVPPTDHRDPDGVELPPKVKMSNSSSSSSTSSLCDHEPPTLPKRPSSSKCNNSPYYVSEVQQM